MTKEEAIEWLNTDDYHSAGYNKALDMAIQALLRTDIPDTNVGDLIYRQAAVDSIMEESSEVRYPVFYAEKIRQLPSAQREPITEIQEILDYLDTTLHPIVSPDNWYVYSEIYDMVSKLPSAQRKGKWIDDCTCSNCLWTHEDSNGFALITNYNFCPNCGFPMEKGEKDESVN